MHGTLRSRILWLVGFAVSITAASIFFFAQRDMRQTVTSSEEQHARDLLNAVELSVEAEYDSLLFHRQATLERRKTELKNIVTLAMTHIEEEYRQYLSGWQTLQQTQREAAQAIKNLRYDDGVGYLWINDLGQPVPRMVMHPTLPELNGRRLDDPVFNTALGTGENLFVAAVERCRAKGEGFIDYLWPKPTQEGLTEQQPKISYVKLFKPWGWVVGTGVYIDDIEAEALRRRDAIIEELKDLFAKVRIVQTGYMFLFNGQGEMLVHPTISGAEFAALKNPVSGRKLYQDFIDVAKNTAQPFDYEWDNPAFKGEYRFPKRAFIAYFKPLDWYIGASMYIEELARPGVQLRERIFVLTLCSLLFALLIAVGLSRRLSEPLRKLVQSAKKIGQKGLGAAEIPISGTAETRELGQVLEQMVVSLRKAEENRLNLEKQMLSAQKLESLGVLAGGIAHDFNNILLAITGNVEMALRRIGKNGSPEKHLQRIKDAADKAADLSRQMLAYSGKGAFLVEQLDLNQLLEGMLQILEVSISKKTTLQLDLTKPLPTIEADATQIRQIILNLILNASEAIGEEEGEIRIATRCIYCEEDDFQANWRSKDYRAGDFVCLEVTDTGCGMAPETIERLFDPFFSTKFTGRGLGMSAVLGIIRSHKGAINISSELGGGSSFQVFLPASGGALKKTEHSAAGDEWKAQGKVLLVDDEQTVRDVGTEMLNELGFSVITAVDGRDAVQVYQQNRDVDFVILDLTMPHMDGTECLRELKKINAAIKVLMSSGYSEQDVLQQQGSVGFVPKPYNIDCLEKAIRDVVGDQQ